MRAAEATARQARSERAADYVAALLALRNNERQVALLPQRKTLLALEAELGIAAPPADGSSNGSPDGASLDA